jgi:hypothetical protein
MGGQTTATKSEQQREIAEGENKDQKLGEIAWSYI